MLMTAKPSALIVETAGMNKAMTRSFLPKVSIEEGEAVELIQQLENPVAEDPLQRILDRISTPILYKSEEISF